MMAAMLVTAVLAQSPAVRVPDASGGEHSIYRNVQPGETRSKGLLRRIVCPGRGPVSFVVKEQQTVVRYTAPQLTSVDFIVYAEDFKGPVTCEGFGDGRPVYVTWKPDGNNKRVIAIEFLRRGD